MIGVIYERVSGPGLCHLYLLRFLLVRGCHTDFLGLWIAFQQFTVADFEWFIIKSKLSFVPFSFWPWNWTSHELRQYLYFPKRGKFHQSFVGWECLSASYSDVLFAITAICLSRRSLHSPLFDWCFCIPLHPLLRHLCLFGGMITCYNNSDCQCDCSGNHASGSSCMLKKQRSLQCPTFLSYKQSSEDSGH